MGSNKGWMFVVQELMVKELDLLARGSGLDRPDFMRKVVAQGILMERHLQDGTTQSALVNELVKKAELKEQEQKRKARKKWTSKPKGTKDLSDKTGKELAIPDDFFDPAELAPSSPSEELSDTVPPSAPIEEPESSEDLLEAVLAQADHICPNPFGDCPECEEAS